MSVLIRGMKMPTNCRECPVLYVTSICDGFKACPLVSVPPHGRLIEADALRRKVKMECNPYGAPTIGYEDGSQIMDMIDNAPTIIPAEGEP